MYLARGVLLTSSTWASLEEKQGLKLQKPSVINQVLDIYGSIIRRVIISLPQLVATDSDLSIVYR